MYGQRLVELRNQEHPSFKNVRWLSPKLLVELLAKVGHRTNKQHTLYRVPLEPDMKFALILRHISSAMKFGERVPHKT